MHDRRPIDEGDGSNIRHGTAIAGMTGRKRKNATLKAGAEIVQENGVDISVRRMIFAEENKADGELAVAELAVETST